MKNKSRKFSQIQLTESETFEIFESPSLLVPKGTEEAVSVEKHNAHYDYATKGPGSVRPRSDVEIQTEIIFTKPREISTENAEKKETGTYVSKFEIFKTYSDIEETTKIIEIDADQAMAVTTYEREGYEDSCGNLCDNEKFQVSSMIVERMLAENIYRNKQKKFRNITKEDPLDLKQEYLYQLEELWSYKSDDTKGKEVVDMSWCPSNGDLLAVAYGAYNYRESKNRIAGAVLIWCIKNPVNPERRYRFQIPVSSVAFSKFSPQLLAVGLYNGSIEVLNITENSSIENGSTIARSDRSTSPVIEPVWTCLWIQEKDEEFIFTASQDGRVMKYKFGSGADLIGYQQLHLERVDGKLDGLAVGDHIISIDAADRHSQALCMQFHPKEPEIYFVGTDEGCIHVCSINLPHQHLRVSQAHKYGVYSIDFSPFSAKIFLTAGSDFAIRIWADDISEPIVVLQDGFEGFHNALWSPINSTIIVSCTKNSVKVWDLRRKNGKPASIRKFGNKLLTVVKFSPCGRSITVGDNEGTTYVCALENFPPAPRFQLDVLMSCLRTSLTGNTDVLNQIKNMGN